MKTPTQMLKEEIILAGYVENMDIYRVVFNGEGCFWFVCEDTNEGGYMVGRFYKATLTNLGEYAAQPDFTSDSYPECIRYLSENIEVRATKFAGTVQAH